MIIKNKMNKNKIVLNNKMWQRKQCKNDKYFIFIKTSFKIKIVFVCKNLIKKKKLIWKSKFSEKSFNLNL